MRGGKAEEKTKGISQSAVGGETDGRERMSCVLGPGLIGARMPSTKRRAAFVLLFNLARCWVP